MYLLNRSARSVVVAVCLASLVPQLGCSGSDTTAGPDPITETPPGEGRFLLSLDASKLPVLQGKRASLPVSVERKDGFEGPVVVSAQGLPPGVVVGPLTIAANETTGELELSAADAAPHSLPT
ncbi:MAG TPA: hypothetical protein VGC79_30825, partial [Polyangiaceae bacterium]